MRHFLELCLKSVKAALKDIDSEIIVVDNHSSDDSCGMVQTLFSDVKLIVNSDNVGFSKANNQGVDQAIGDYICILNPDTVLGESTFKNLLDYAESLSDLGALGCQLIDGTGAFLPESKRNVPVVRVAGEKLLGKTKKYYANHINPKDTGKVDVLVGAFMLLKRSVYLDVGGFDEDYFMYGEDIDLSYKLIKAGYSNYYYGNETIIHFKGESTQRNKEYNRRFYDAMRLFYRKHFKSNWMFDKLVGFGTQTLAFRSIHQEKPTTRPLYYVVVSSLRFPELEKELNTAIHYSDDLLEYTEGVEYILDNHYLAFSKIIELLKSKPENKRITFKILPKNSNFILGSNSSIEQGKVILF